MTDEELSTLWKQAADTTEPVLKEGYGKANPEVLGAPTEEDLKKAASVFGGYAGRVPAEKELLSFPIQRSLRRKYIGRRGKQVLHAEKVLASGGLVILTPGFTVYAAKSVWGLLWAYFKYWIRRSDRA